MKSIRIKLDVLSAIARQINSTIQAKSSTVADQSAIARQINSTFQAKSSTVADQSAIAEQNISTRRQNYSTIRAKSLALGQIYSGFDVLGTIALLTLFRSRI